MPHINIENLLDKFAMLVFFLVVLWMVNKYLNIRLNAMKSEIEREIKEKRLRGTGSFEIFGEKPKVGNITIDLTLGLADKE